MLLSVHQLFKQFRVDVCLNSVDGIWRKPCVNSFLEIIVAEYDAASGLYLSIPDFDMSEHVKEHCYAALTEFEPSDSKDMYFHISGHFRRCLTICTILMWLALQG